MSDQRATYNIALAGNPNVGKSSIFNRLTGLRQKVGNFPGVTVDKKSGTIRFESRAQAEVTDLPGLYSLYPTSEDEKVVLNILLEEQSEKYPDAIGYIADANDLERHLLLCSQLIDLRIPIVLGLNMTDTAAGKGISIDSKKLSDALGIEVVEINGRTGEGVDEFKRLLEATLKSGHKPKHFYELSPGERQIAKDVSDYLRTDAPYKALLLTHHAGHLEHLSDEQKQFIRTLKEQYSFDSLDLQLDEIMSRYRQLGPIVKSCVSLKPVKGKDFSSRADRILTHPVFGILIFMVLMILVFQSIFSWSEWPMTVIEESFAGLSSILSERLPDAWFSRLLTEGVVAGLSGVLVFVPQIAILFLLISILEESGYMARVVYLFDHIMRRFGLNGRSVVALISGGACAIPAIMSTRTITNWKERLITILVTPLISCSARIPVFTILIAVTIPAYKLFGWINIQGLVFLGLYALGAAAALLSALVFSRILKTEEPGFLIMELPQYQVPQWKNVGLTVVEKVKTFSWEAGRIIMLVSIVLWFLASYGRPSAMEKAREQAAAEFAVSQEISLDQLEATHELEASFAGTLGKFIEPVIAPLGYDWKIGIALITSFAAREVFVGTMATIYAVGDESDEALLRQRMSEAQNMRTGEKVFTLPTAVSLMIFYLFAMQCMSTLAVVRRETKSWKWPAVQLAYMSVLAYGAAFAVYKILGIWF
jgi:ferrous iron transport protein B